MEKKQGTSKDAGPKIVFMLGSPGCGKGTQARKLAQDFGYTRISIGDAFRAEVKRV